MANMKYEKEIGELHPFINLLVMGLFLFSACNDQKFDLIWFD